MTQTVPALAVLGTAYTGLAIGYRVLYIGGSVYSAFGTANVAEGSVAGTYRVNGGITAPDAGGYIVWGISTTDYAEATIEPAATTAGRGATSQTVNVTVGGVVTDGVEVWVTTDSAGANVVSSGVTDALGNVTFLLDAGTYYVWKQLAGANFTNPETMVVS